MLIALELAGFKSFAEKTRFDFPDGITVIVGPNGSGKSNVVDAIKWVLGAQSAKALRGKDMIDVIFKGSSSAGRKPCNTAEATLVFDNRERLLEVDADEVSVTRRVYRSGEGEYLINGQPCRLKDIKNLFRGTGVGVDAYSLIEQGKVDRMLQASPKDRRVIFEEAAGISRFNAKKAEANRRLDRVDQNLVRLKDIVDEVQTRLNRLKSQATKAQRFREMTSRLNELRLRLGWTEFSQFNEKVAAIDEQLEQLTLECKSKTTELQESTEAAQAAELELHEVARECQAVDGRLQDALQRIAVYENQQSTLRQRIEEAKEEELRQTTRLNGLHERTTQMQQEVAAARTELEATEKDAADQSTRVDAAAKQAESLKLTIDEITESCEKSRGTHVELLRDASRKSGERAEKKKELEDLKREKASLEAQLAENDKASESATNLVASTKAKLAEAQNALKASQRALEQAKSEFESEQSAFGEANKQIALITGRLSGAEERFAILEELQQHLDGVDGGARHLLEMASESETPTLRTIHGLVADLFSVDVELASLIDTSLGPAANILVIENDKIIEELRTGAIEVPGRLSLLQLDKVPTRRFGEKVQLDGVGGVVGRADRLVRCKNTYLPVIRYLLGTTWLVENLDIALELGHFRGAGLRFITRSGELIESDGLLTLGAIQSASGLVSRRSEMQGARDEIKQLKHNQVVLQSTLQENQLRIEQTRPKLAEFESAVAEQTQSLARHHALHKSALESQEELRGERVVTLSAVDTTAKKQAAILPLLADLESECETTQKSIEEIENQIADASKHLAEHEQQLARQSEQVTAAKIDAARQEQRVESAQANFAQIAQTLEERQQAEADIESEILRAQTKQTGSTKEIEQLGIELKTATETSKQEEAKQAELADKATELRERCQATRKLVESAKRALDKIEQTQTTSNLERTRFEESRDTLLKRYSEDYQIAFEDLEQAELIEDSDEQTSLNEEASKLRQDIASVGEINMAALAELDELQERYDFLNGQYEDLVAAKESLQRIIQKINQDSRRLFTETLEVIRQNFQKLYRKCFGGGSADIVLEEGEDVLECGIDIIATPPGKTELSNSLLSGGEKALTAVALLLAIFQHRPSPFCVLDEVDAPFDEANIGRFVNVLNEFLDWTKFIIVTHSKKTMTASTTLYGVTMQESGVSKQVAVKFEDVNEKGEIISDKRRAA